MSVQFQPIEEGILPKSLQPPRNGSSHKKLRLDAETNVFDKFPFSFHNFMNKKRFAEVFGRRPLKMLQNGSFYKELYFEAEHNITYFTSLPCKCNFCGIRKHF